jgi:hypothetical protein
MAGMETLRTDGVIVSLRRLMCTVSFVPKHRGFYLAMNRDEKLTRSAAVPPEAIRCGKRRAIFPHERSGGTWIAANDAGICLALLNWHKIPGEPAAVALSRGVVVARLASVSSLRDVAGRLSSIPLQNLRPFRLIVVDQSAKMLIECRWDLRQLRTWRHAWHLQHWFSSGFDEATAETRRRLICREARNQKSRGTLRWLRRLHRSHRPRPSAFSICMHRSVAATVSYTEIVGQNERMIMRYKPGPPCASAPSSELKLAINVNARRWILSNRDRRSKHQNRPLARSASDSGRRHH